MSTNGDMLEDNATRHSRINNCHLNRAPHFRCILGQPKPVTDPHFTGYRRQIGQRLPTLGALALVPDNHDKVHKIDQGIVANAHYMDKAILLMNGEVKP
jgi:hypothetical protein